MQTATIDAALGQVSGPILGVRDVSLVPAGTRWLVAGSPDFTAAKFEWSSSAGVDRSDPYGARIGPYTSGTPQLIANHLDAGSMVNNVLVVELRALDDRANANGFNLYLGNYGSSNRSVGGVGRETYRPEAGRVCVQIQPKALQANAGTGLDLTNLVTFNMVFLAPSGGSHTVYVSRIGVAPMDPARRNGVAFIDLDDCSAGQLEHLVPLMVARGIPGHIVGINERVRTGEFGWDLATVRDLIDNHGWTYVAHSDTVAEHDHWDDANRLARPDLYPGGALTALQKRERVQAARIGALKLGLPADFGAYPFGSNDSGVRAQMRNAGFVSARTVGGFGALTNVPPIVDGNRYTTPGIAYSVANHGLITSNSAYCKNNALEFCLLFHNAKAGASSGEVVGATDAATILDALVATGLTMTTRDKVWGL